MKRIRNLIIFLFLICSAKLFAYDYPWPVDYRFNVSSKKDVTKVNEVVEQFVYDNPDLYVYTVNWKAYSEDTELKEEYLKLYLKYIDQEPFGKILDGTIYLEDVNTCVGFSILPVSDSDSGSVYITIDFYNKDIEKINEKIIIKQKCEWYSFNDVEPTEEETKIKESFEKNFLAKLPLETEYVDPGNLDKNLSKILRFLKKWKIKYIFIIGIIVLIIRIIYVICRNIENKEEERKFFKKAIENRKKLEEE